MNPAIATFKGIGKDPPISNAVNRPAPEMAGIASKNENLAASFADNPKNKAVLIVIPLRDIPGIIAIA